MGSVLRNRFNAESDIHCVVPSGATTFVFGSASKEYKQLLGSSSVLNAQSQSTLEGGFSPSAVETDVMVGRGTPRAANISVRYVDRS